RSGTHVSPTAGLMLIATTTCAVWKQDMSGGPTADAGAPAATPDAAPVDATEVTGGSGGSSGGSGTPTGGAPGGGGTGGAATDTGGSGVTTEPPSSHSSAGCSYGGGDRWPAGLLLFATALATLCRRRR